MQFKNLFAVTTILTAPLLFAPGSANAASFEITNGQTVTSTQTLGSGDTGTVDHGGTISVAGDGIDASSNSTTINNGTISTTNNGLSIYLNGSNATATNNGLITTGGNTIASSMVLAFGSSNITLTNNGTITNTSTDSGRGMDIDTGANSGNHLINNGAITTSGTNSFGMLDVDNTSSNNTLINNGTITTTNTNAGGMSTAGISDIVTNNGTISTSGASANGMNAGGINSILTNNGHINLSNSNALGMNADAAGVVATNNGIIAGTAFNTDGMSAAVSNTTLINNGRITNTGTFADGIGTAAATTGQTIINNGIITVNGTGGGTGAINNFSTGSTITNNGILNAPGTGGIAIINNAAGNTVILDANSQTNGGISFNGGGNALQYNVAGAGRAGGSIIVTGPITGAATTSITGTGSLASGAKVVQSGNNVAVVTPDSFAGTNQVVTQTLTHVGDIVNNRQAGGTTGTSTGDAVAGGRTAWAEGFGSYQERPENNQTDSSRAKAGGALFGLDFPQNSNGYKSGFYVGGFAGTIDIGSPKFREIDSTGGLAGAYIGKEFNKVYVNAQLAAGYASNDSDRYVSGTDASADYHSVFISPAVTVSRPYKTSGVTWTPSATVRYTLQRDNSYDEKGSTADQNVDSNISNTLTGRAQLEARLDDEHIGSGIFKPALRAGVEGQTYIGSRSINVTALGTNVSFDPSGDDNYVDGIVGVNLSYAINNGPEIYLDAEGDIGLNKGGPSHNFGGTGRAGLRFKF